MLLNPRYTEPSETNLLLLKAVERYAMTYGAPKMAGFQAEPDIQKALTAFFETTVNTATDGARGGCMMAAAALGQSERVMEIRSCAAKAFTAAADIFAKGFEKKIKSGRLTRTPSAMVRAVRSLTCCSVCNFALRRVSLASNCSKTIEATCT